MASPKYPYVVILKNTTSKPFTILAILLNLASVVFFAKEAIFAAQLNYISIFIQLVVLGMIAWNVYWGRKGHKAVYDRVYLITAILWGGMPYMQWLLIPFILLALLEHQVKFPLEIGFSETQIVFNTLFRKKYKWSDLTNVMLKDGILTMDFANNRLLQRPVEDDDEEDDITEEEFNEFCRQQLDQHGNFSRVVTAPKPGRL